MDLAGRARLHATLGDPHRLRIVDELVLGDRTFQALAALVELPGNAAAHHLAVLESAGLIGRRQSDGDRRRRYITLHRGRLDVLAPSPFLAPAAILFVCTHNSARSQFAAALWRERTGSAADSAGTEPADRVHPKAARAAAEFGLDLADAVPKGYDAVAIEPDLVVSVCDRAREAGVPFSAPQLHWSVPDPVRSGTQSAFRSAFADISQRIDQLAKATPH
jgi:protein-tyrosine-phosphatase/DNA-binding transcriptional ArsR family regulator